MPHQANTLSKYLVLILLVAVPLEFASYMAGRCLAREGLIYIPRHPAPADYDRYQRSHDPVLGWRSEPGARGVEFDSSGSRIVPAFPDPSRPACVALFGDSFTWGFGVKAEDAYGNRLAQRLGCRVANYGVSGQGTDQTLLRYEQIKPTAPLVVLGYYSNNIVRNVTQNMDFIVLKMGMFGFKPRFVLDDAGRLRLIPLPVLSREQYENLPDRVSELFPYDYCLPGGPSGLTTLRFPYSLSVLRVLHHYRLRARLRGELPWAQFYGREHDSQAFAVTTAILDRFAEETRRRGQLLLVLFIPDWKDIEALRRHRSLAFQPLIDELRRRGIASLSLAEGLDAYLGTRPTNHLYFKDGHFRPEANQEIAMLAEQALRRMAPRGVFPPLKASRRCGG